jgi:CheY-like chemotaxis protein
MPGMDGYAVCRELLAAPETSDIPVIFVTALKSPEDETRALGAGAADFISKPVNAAVVRARVRTQLTVKRQRDALRALILHRRPDRRRQPPRLRRAPRCRMAALRARRPAGVADDGRHRPFQAVQRPLRPPGRRRHTGAGGRRHAARGRRAARTWWRATAARNSRSCCPSWMRSGATGVARRLMHELEMLDLPHAASPTSPRLTASIGIACDGAGRAQCAGRPGAGGRRPALPGQGRRPKPLPRQRLGRRPNMPMPSIVQTVSPCWLTATHFDHTTPRSGFEFEALTWVRLVAHVEGVAGAHRRQPAHAVQPGRTHARLRHQAVDHHPHHHAAGVPAAGDHAAVDRLPRPLPGRRGRAADRTGWRRR